MAFSIPLSSSMRKGQIAMLCQLCENDPQLKWKCLDCGFIMCQRCKEKVHPKFPSAEDHNVLDIKEMGTDQTHSKEPKLDFTKLKCEVHAGKYCCMFCKTCQNLVCPTCIAETHNKHNLHEIDQEYQTKLEEVKIREDELKERTVSISKNELKLKQIKLTEQSNYEKVKQEILDNEKALVPEIKKHTNKLIKDLDQKWDSISNHIKDEEKKLKARKDQIQKQSQTVDQFRHSENAKDFFASFDSLLKSTETNIPPVNSSFDGVPKLISGDKTKIPLIFGKLENVTIQYSTELQVDKTFDTDLESIDNVISCPDGCLWLSDFNSDILQKVKPNGDNLKVMSDLKTEVYDTALLPSGDLLLSNASSNLKLVPFGSTDIQDSVFTVPSLDLLAVHVTCDNKVVVGAAGGKSNFPANGPRQVIMMNQTGHHEKVFQYDRHNKPLFTFPRFITSNSQGNIAVVDRVSDDGRGRVVVLDLEGEVRNIYTGHPDVNDEDNPFNNQVITTTPSDNFVVADVDNHTLHILNSEGEIITFYNTEEMGILLPWSLSFSTIGQLYIGCFAYKDSKDNAKLFRVNNFLH